MEGGESDVVVIFKSIFYITDKNLNLCYHNYSTVIYKSIINDVFCFNIIKIF